MFFTLVVTGVGEVGWRSGSNESFGEMHLHFVSHARKESQKESD